MTTAANPKPFVLVIDDKVDDVLSDVRLGLEDGASFDVIHPRDAALADLEKADLVLVDYRLEDWLERDSQECIGLRPLTGMALAAILREYVDKSKNDRLTALALYSAHLDKVRGRLPMGSAQHVVARLHNLEWAFPKTEPRLYDQMIILAQAVGRLPREWPNGEDESASKLKSVLGMNKEASWFDRCWREVQECQPPIHDLRGGEHGMLLIRWLLHRVMPYPTFLWGVHWVAARLRVPVDSLLKAMKGGNQLAEDLRERKYSGLLEGFLGDRWWRGALEDYVWDLVGGQTGDAKRLRAALTERAGHDLGMIDANPPVVCLNSDLQPTGQFTSPGEAVRLRPDHWPAFADAAWMDIETVQNDPALAAMVEPLDQDRIGAADEE